MSRILLALIASTIAFGGIVFILMRNDRPGNNSVDSGEPIVLFCAASNRAVMESIREEYEKEYGRSVQIQYGASQPLLSSLEVSSAGDLFLPADDIYLDIAKSGGIVEEVLPIARMQAVVAIKKGNPKRIESLDDLLDSRVRLVQASPDAAAVGKVARRVLKPSGDWEKLDKATQAYRTTVTDVANDIVIGAADAGIVYDAVLHTYPDVEYVELPELAEANSQISIGVIATTKQPQSALHFARYVASKDRGLSKYSEHGFRVSGGDKWDSAPEITVFAGSMLRPAIEETIVAFEQREGVSVSRIYNGCGILVGNMKAGSVPDAYFACDSEFMTQVADHFPDPISVSQNELVILVQKGNPHKIASLRDLTREGIRVGVGHEKQCAMGWLTQNTFREGGLQKEVMKNVTVQTPTGDMLVNQLRAGSLDAAVAYLSNAAGSGEFLDAVQITGIECSTATQPWAIAGESEFPHLASRLFEKICSAESQETFSSQGFSWQLDAALLEAEKTTDPVSE